MPLYEYKCRCGGSDEVLRGMAHRDDPMFCRECKNPMRRDFSVPAVKVVERPHAFWRRDRDSGPSAGPAIHTWDSERRFPNLRKEGDGAMAFPSKAAYNAYLKQEDIAELSTDARIEKPHGNVTVSTGK